MFHISELIVLNTREFMNLIISNLKSIYTKKVIIRWKYNGVR